MWGNFIWDYYIYGGWETYIKNTVQINVTCWHKITKMQKQTTVVCCSFCSLFETIQPTLFYTTLFDASV